MPLPAAGARLRASDLASIFSTGVDAWTPYTPVFTGTGTPPTLGNGTISGAYTKIGRTVFFRLAMAAGTTTTYGASSVFLWSTPTNMASTLHVSGWFQDVSAGLQFTRLGHTYSVNQFYFISEGGVYVSGVAPFTWANTDQAQCNGFYDSTT